jgi:hypothetical protein
MVSLERRVELRLAEDDVRNNPFTIRETCAGKWRTAVLQTFVRGINVIHPSTEKSGMERAARVRRRGFMTKLSTECRGHSE